MTLTLDSPAFPHNAMIPKHFSRNGGNVSPPLEWQGAPVSTRSYALVVEDPDAQKGSFRHWAAYDIPPVTQHLAEGAGSDERSRAMQMARNDFGNPYYDGPQPPPGHGTHHYHFRLFALDIPELDVSEDCDAGEVLEAARAHCIAEAEAIGTFERRQEADRAIAKKAQCIETDPTPFAPAKRNPPMGSPGLGSKPDTVQPHIADADKLARTGSLDEQVRNTPPAGDWNDDA